MSEVTTMVAEIRLKSGNLSTLLSLIKLFATNETVRLFVVAGQYLQANSLMLANSASLQFRLQVSETNDHASAELLLDVKSLVSALERTVRPPRQVGEYTLRFEDHQLIVQGLSPHNQSVVTQCQVTAVTQPVLSEIEQHGSDPFTNAPYAVECKVEVESLLSGLMLPIGKSDLDIVIGTQQICFKTVDTLSTNEFRAVTTYSGPRAYSASLSSTSWTLVRQIARCLANSNGKKKGVADADDDADREPVTSTTTLRASFDGLPLGFVFRSPILELALYIGTKLSDDEDVGPSPGPKRLKLTE